MRHAGLCSLLLVLMVWIGGGQARAAGVGNPDLGKQRPDGGKLQFTSGRPMARTPAGVGDPQGETMADALPIGSLPFSGGGDTCDHLDDYDVACPYAGFAPDIVYAYTPSADQRLDIDLCGTAYDSKVYLLDEAGNDLACNEDYYRPADPCGGYVARLSGAAVAAGQTVFIVVDGYGAACGTYAISVTEYVPCDLVCGGDSSEGEPALHDNYDDVFNGGCTSSAFVAPYQVLVGDQNGRLDFCGVSGFYGGADDFRDTDWFAVTLGATGTATWTLSAAQETIGYVLGLECPAPPVYGVLVVGACESGSLQIVGSPGRNFGLWVAPAGYTPPLNMSGNEYAYEMTIEGLSAERAVAVEAVSWGSVKGRFR